MKNKRVKSFCFISPEPEDIYNDMVDIFVTLEDDDFEYWIEMATPKAFSTYMEKNNQKFLEPRFPFIIVSELTSAVIEEALNAFATEREDAYCLKLYHLTVEFNRNDLNTMLHRYKKRENNAE